jgi:hypothetical protein
MEGGDGQPPTTAAEYENRPVSVGCAPVTGMRTGYICPK